MTRNEKLILFFLFLVYFLWFALPVAMVGTDDWRMVDAFNVDESFFLPLLKNEVRSHGFNMNFYAYSHLYFNSGLLPLAIAEYFSPASEQTIMILFRILSALYFLGTILVVFLIGKRFFGKITAWLSVILMFTTCSQLFVYSTLVHPDTAQLFFISLGIYFCCRYFEAENERNWKYLAFSAAAAGLAFGTKYAGIMLMPIIAGIALLDNKDKRIPGKAKFWIALFFCVVASVVLNKNWIIKYIPSDEKSAGFYLLVFLGRIISASAGLFLIAGAVFEKKISQSKIFSWVLEKLVSLILLSGIFTLAFAISSPGCVRGLNFISGFISVTDLARYGHAFRLSLGVSGWLKVLLSEGVMIYPVFILMLVNIFFSVHFWIKSGIKKVIFSLILFFWTAIYFATLVMRINADFAHYLLPLVPFIILLSAATIEIMVKYISKRISLINPILITILLPLILMGYSVFNSAGNVIRTRNMFVYKIENSDAVKAGLWLKDNFPSETRILCDMYAYVPAKFSTCFSSWGISQRQIWETMPRVIILNAPFNEKFSKAEDASAFLTGSAEYMEIHNCYKALVEEKNDFKLIKDFGKIKIYSTEKIWKKKILFQSVNDFEMPAEKWSTKTDYDTLKVFSGKKSELISGEYSSTFASTLSEIFGDTLKAPLFFSATVHGLLSEGASALLVIDFCREGKSMSWVGKNFSDVVSEAGQWKEINYSRQIPNILPSDRINIYVWNTSGKPVFIDNFKVEAYAFE